MSQFSFATTAELGAQGHTVRTIRTAIDAGELERVIKGWYANPNTDRDAIRAMRLGGRLGCVSALRLHGAWWPPESGLHVAFPSFASGRRLSGRGLPDGAVSHWYPKSDHTGSSFPVMPIEMAVDHVLECQPTHFAVAIFDSLLHRRLISRNRLEAAIARGPIRRRFLRGHLEPRSEEGIESITRFRLAVAGIGCDVQVVVNTVHRVDLLIDGWLVIELDGRQTHAQQDAFTRDRVRTAQLFRAGRIVLQFPYASVVYDWDFVLETIRSVMTQYAPVR